MAAFDSTTLEKSRVDFAHEQSLQTCAPNRTARTQHQYPISFIAITSNVSTNLLHTNRPTYEYMLC